MKSWAHCFRRIQHNGYNYAHRAGDDFGRKLATLVLTWNRWRYQLKGSPGKVRVVREYHTIEERLKACVRYWGDNRRIRGWAQTFENMRSNWRDRGKYLKGRTEYGYA